MKPIETILGIAGEGQRRIMKIALLSVYHYHCIVRAFVNVTMYLQHNNNMIKKGKRES
jgi:hypothetical protein